MKLVSMKRSKQERESRNKPVPYDGDTYGYGLCIRLDEQDLKKLGLKPSSFDIGDEVSVRAKGVIKTLHANKGASFDNASVEIQLQSLGVSAGSLKAAVSQGVADADDE